MINNIDAMDFDFKSANGQTEGDTYYYDFVPYKKIGPISLDKEVNSEKVELSFAPHLSENWINNVSCVVIGLDHPENIRRNLKIDKVFFVYEGEKINITCIFYNFIKDLDKICDDIVFLKGTEDLNYYFVYAYSRKLGIIMLIQVTENEVYLREISFTGKGEFENIVNFYREEEEWDLMDPKARETYNLINNKSKFSEPAKNNSISINDIMSEDFNYKLGTIFDDKLKVKLIEEGFKDVKSFDFGLRQEYYTNDNLYLSFNANSFEESSDLTLDSIMILGNNQENSFLSIKIGDYNLSAKKMLECSNYKEAISSIENIKKYINFEKSVLLELWLEEYRVKKIDVKKITKEELIEFENQDNMILLQKSITRTELIQIVRSYNFKDGIDKLLTILERLSTILKTYTYYLDERFIEYGRRKIIYDEFFRILSGEDTAHRRKTIDLYNIITEYIMGYNDLSLSQYEMYCKNVGNSKTLEEVLLDMGEYRKEGIISITEKNIIESMVDIFIADIKQQKDVN